MSEPELPEVDVKEEATVVYHRYVCVRCGTPNIKSYPVGIPEVVKCTVCTQRHKVR